MEQPANDTEKTIGRRELLKAVAATGGAVAAATLLPGEWVKPVVKVGLLPAHAQVSPPVVYSISCSADGGGSTPDRVPQNGIITDIQARVSPIPPEGVGVRGVAQTTDPANPGPFETDSFTDAGGIAVFPNFDLTIVGPFATGTLITFTFTFVDQAQWGPASCSTIITVEAAAGSGTGSGTGSGSTSPWKNH